MDNDLKKKIADDFGLKNLPQEEQDKFIEKIGSMLFEAVVERAVDIMDEGTMTGFEEVLNNAGEDYSKVVSFLRDQVPGFKEIVSDEMHRLKRTTSGIFA